MAEKYVCGYCGAEYGTPVERAKCEFECDEKHKQEIERAAKEKLKAEKESRKASVRLAYQNFAELRDQYIKDYREPVAFEIGGAQDGGMRLWYHSGNGCWQHHRREREGDGNKANKNLSWF